MRTIIVEPLYRLCRLEEEKGHIYKKEIIKTNDFQVVLQYTKKEVLLNGKDINIEVW